MQVCREDLVGAEQALDAHRRRHVGQHQQSVQVGQRQDQLAEHAVRAVDEGKALLFSEDDRFDAMRAQSVRGGHDCAIDGADLALAHDRQGHVRKGCKVA
jgi:hypothetical protein